MGRPSKYKPECCETLRTNMADGLSFEACCGLLGIDKTTGYDWIKRYPEFAKSKAEGSVLGQLFWEKAALSGMWSDAGSKFNTGVWIFIMKNQYGWRDKKEIVGLDGGALFSDLTAPQLEQKIEEIARRLPAEVLALIGKGKP